MSSSRTAISAELGIALVGPEGTLVPLMASLYYSCNDPYAVRVAFHVGTDKPVEWTLARELLAAALHSREGIGDIQAWPSVTSIDADEDGKGAFDYQILNLAMTSPFGQAQFEIGARDIEEFLHRTFAVVPVGQESSYLDFDAELNELLSQA